MVTNLFIGVLGSVLAAEVYMWLPALAAWMVRLAASRLPRMSDRYREEWSADLDDVPGHGAKLIYAVELLVGLRQVRRALPKTEVRSAVFTAAGSSTVTSVSETLTPSTDDVEIRVPSTTALGLAGPTPRVVINEAGQSTALPTFEGWEMSTTGANAYHPVHHRRDARWHPAYGLTVSQVILPLEGTTRSEST